MASGQNNNNNNKNPNIYSEFSNEKGQTEPLVTPKEYFPQKGYPGQPNATPPNLYSARPNPIGPQSSQTHRPFQPNATGSAGGISRSGQLDVHITEAYRQFEHRLDAHYKICERPEDKSTREIEQMLRMEDGNVSQWTLDFRRVASKFCAPLFCCTFPCLLYYKKSAKFAVPNNHFALVEDHSKGKPETKIYGPGYHYLGLYHYLKLIHSFQKKVPNNLIQAPLGDLTIITVDQGTIALFEYNGQFKILGPGLHLIRDTVQFRNTIKLDNFYIKVGPEKWITIPDQYDGIAINNGKTVILEGGKQHHLYHENFKFAKLVPKIILTDRVVTDVTQYVDSLSKTHGEIPALALNRLDPVVYLQTKTKDGAVIYLDSMLFWEIENTEVAAHKAMNVMELRKSTEEEIQNEQVHIQSASRNIDNLRKTVLRFAKSCLAESVGHVCLTDDDLFFRDKFSDQRDKLAAAAGSATSRVSTTTGESDTALVTMNFAIQNFLNAQTDDLVAQLNNDLREFGVRVTKITINNAIPTPEVQEQLDKQAKAKIDRNTDLVIAETAKQVAEQQMMTDRINRLGEAKNRLEAAKITKQTMETNAAAEAETTRIIAQGRKDAAEIQESSTLGRELAIMEAVSNASKAFNSGKGEKVYVVGSPLEAVTQIAGKLLPAGLMSNR